MQFQMLLNYFIMIDVGNLQINLEGYFELYFVTIEVDNLDAKIMGSLYIFS